MIHLQRKIKCRFAGDVKYLPEDVPNDKFLPAIGYEVRRREVIREIKDKEMRGYRKVAEIKEDIYYLVINNKGKLVPIASFNTVTMIDERAEMDVNRIAELLHNLTVIGKVLCEKNNNEKSPDAGTEGGGKKPRKKTG